MLNISRTYSLLIDHNPN